jgi:nondiscriminating glutamyl-tRNA synthetase
VSDADPTRAGSTPPPFALSPGQSALAWSKFAPKMPPFESASEPVKAWFSQMLVLFIPQPDRASEQIEQLASTTAFLFGFDVEAAHARPENSALLSGSSARIVLAELADRARVHTGSVTAELFHNWLDEIQSATGVHGAELLVPITIAITGSPAGPDIDKLVPLIEQGISLGLPIPSVRARIERFVGV